MTQEHSNGYPYGQRDAGGEGPAPSGRAVTGHGLYQGNAGGGAAGTDGQGTAGRTGYPDGYGTAGPQGYGAAGQSGYGTAGGYIHPQPADYGEEAQAAARARLKAAEEARARAQEEEARRRKKRKRITIAAVLAIAAGLYAYDGAVWSRGEWGTYRRFDDSRIAMSDYGIPAYGVSNGQKNQNQNYHFDILQNNGDYKRNMNSNLNINGSISYDFGWSEILKGLKLRFSYSKSINTDKGNEYGSSYTLYQMVNRYGSGHHLYTPVGGEDDSYLNVTNFNAITLGNGNYLSRSSTRTDNYQINFTAQYDRAFGDHHVSALFSIEKSEAESEYQTTQREAPYEFTTGQYNSATGEISGTFTRSESGTLSYIGRLNYSYLNKYLLELLLRSDASTKFAPENYWGTFPAASAGCGLSACAAGPGCRKAPG